MTLIKSVSGVRGLVKPDGDQPVTLTDDLARDFGRAYATYLKRSKSVGADAFLVAGRDGRMTGQRILDAFRAGAASSGIDVIDLGIMTTPGVAMMVRELGAVGGIVVTASHNPGQWNGLKLMTADGQAPRAVEAEKIFAVLDAGDFPDSPVANGKTVDVDPHEHHVSAVLEIVDVAAIRSRGFRVVLDSINGAGATAGRMLLESLGCAVTYLNANPADDFAHMPEPVGENLGQLCEAVSKHGADVGFAQDPDADRLAIVDEGGRFIGEEYTLALCARRVFETTPGPAAANLSTSRMIDDVAAASGCVVHRSAVGEANVVEVMQQRGCVIGGEGNGGIIDPRVVHVRDSLVGMALVLDLLAGNGSTVASEVGRITRYTMLKEKVTCDRERIAAAVEAVREHYADEQINDIDGVRVDWPGEKKWVHVRGSNTEPIMRVIVEAADAEAGESLMAEVRGIVGG